MADEWRCQEKVALGRPDRGPTRPCPNRALFFIRSHGRVCGVHARAWLPGARSLLSSGICPECGLFGGHRIERAFQCPRLVILDAADPEEIRR